jgi:hypothetical protein
MAYGIEALTPSPSLAEMRPVRTEKLPLRPLTRRRGETAVDLVPGESETDEARSIRSLPHTVGPSPILDEQSV